MILNGKCLPKPSIIGNDGDIKTFSKSTGMIFRHNRLGIRRKNDDKNGSSEKC
jgi:hypothetical protein